MTDEPNASDRRSVFADATQVAGTGEVMIELDRACTSASASSRRCRDINLNVGRQEVVVVIGPSGSGKSTMIRCINRLEEHDARPHRGRRHRAVARHPQHPGDPPRDGDGVPAVQPVPAPDRARQHHAGAPRRCARSRRREAERAGDGAARAGAHPRAGEEVPGPAVRRPAAAGRDRPGAGDEAEGDAVRRADVGARPGDDQRGPRHDEGPRRARA